MSFSGMAASSLSDSIHAFISLPFALLALPDIVGLASTAREASLSERPSWTIPEARPPTDCSALMSSGEVASAFVESDEIERVGIVDDQDGVVR